MCWSGEASAVLASIGIGTTLYAAYKGEPPQLWITLGYFSLMELLQAFTYSVIDRCSLPSNQIATLLGYLHIAFQPFFINAMALYFIPKDVAQKVAPWVYAFCFASVIFMIIQVYPFEWAGTCAEGRTLCAPRLCSVHGNWHIAWDVPTNGIGNMFAHTPARGFPTYLLAAFLLPFLYGSWRLNVYHMIFGPGLAHLLSQNMNERPAIWCLLSIGILVLVVKTPLRQYLHVKNFPLWRKTTGEPATQEDQKT
jgi:Family of unknown function (DUF5765)